MPLYRLPSRVNFSVEIKIKHRLHNAVIRYIADGKINGKRKRKQFDTKRQAELFITALPKEPVQMAYSSGRGEREPSGEVGVNQS